MQLEERPSLLFSHLVTLKKVTMLQLIEQTQLSKRQILYDFEKLNHWLKQQSLTPIVYKRTQVIEVPEAVLQYAYNKMQESNDSSFFFSEEERMMAIYMFLFIRQEPISSAHFTSLLNVSKNTVVSDVKKTNEIIQPFLVKIDYSRQKGYHLKGTELDKRVLLMYTLMKLLQKPLGPKIIQYLLEGANHRLQQEKILHILRELESTHSVQFVEERLHEFAYFLQFYTIRQHEHKRARLHSDEIDALLHDPIKKVAEELVARLEIDFDDSELAYIIMQLLGLSLGNKSITNNELDLLIDICKKLVSDFEQKTCVSFENKKNIIETLYQHLKPAYFRMKYRVPINNPLLEQIKREHRDLYAIVKEILLPVELLLNITIPEEEIGFITIHFGALLEKPKQSLASRKKALVICPSGVSSSLMVKHELQSLFSEIVVERTMSLHEFKNEKITEYELIFSTVPLQTKLPYFQVKPIMTPVEKSTLLNEVYEHIFGIKYHGVTKKDLIHIIEEFATVFDKDGLEKALSRFTFHRKSDITKGEKPVLSDLITKDNIQLIDEISDWEDAIQQSAKPLLEKGVIEPSYTEAIINNVKTLGPYIIIGPEIAIPHARPEMGVNKLGMSLLKLSKPVYFLNDEKNPVTILFCLAAIDNTTHLKALSQLTQLLSDKEQMERLKSIETIEEMEQLIKDSSLVEK
ncbi:BglG family transcription antiterminator [Bacillus sp. JJ722]|uniref:BglG family transcription antiterminator n=1 Tax=Bacillus sp. JJ722 TaxID=3122973 RepID=UPI002FFD7B10